MSILHPSLFLRRVLLADAVISGAAGLFMMLGAGPLQGVLGLPADLLSYAGLSLIPFALFVGYLGTRESLPRPLLWAVIGYNALWAIDSILLLATGWVEPTMLGHAFVIAQALVVAGLAELQYVGARRSMATA